MPASPGSFRVITAITSASPVHTELRAKFGEINALLRRSCSLAQPCGQMLWAVHPVDATLWQSMVTYGSI